MEETMGSVLNSFDLIGIIIVLTALIRLAVG